MVGLVSSIYAPENESDVVVSFWSCIATPASSMGKPRAVARHARRTKYVGIVNFISVGDWASESLSRSF
jgi:hypothetical protein